MEARSPKRIIIFCLPGIGDAILFTPALALLRRAFPSAHITALTMFRGTTDILSTNPDLNEVRHFDFFGAPRWKVLRYIWALRQEGFDLSIMTFPSNRREYNAVNRIVGRRWRAAHRYRHQSQRNLWFLNNIVVREDGTLHNVEENLRLVRAVCERVGVPLREELQKQPVKLKLVLTADDERYGEEFLARHEIRAGSMLFGFHTYSSTFKNMHRKCWDRDGFVELIQRLGQAYPTAGFLLFSGPSDDEVNRYIAERVRDRVVLVQESNLRRALGVMKHCQAFVSNDSGIMHMAATLGVPLVALFGPTDWRRLHPWSENHVVVRKDLPCMPCFYYSSNPLRCVANINYACMREISVDEVLTAVQAMVASPHATVNAQR
ncbi:MAG TPA: glycosyltransferase family 9 protein [Verrucomicrobiae bacterium]|nr:glycosyltransferase family 9 protein [Verrucomicrobiae bacterium]